MKNENIITQLEKLGKLFLLVLGWALTTPPCAWADDGAVYIDGHGTPGWIAKNIYNYKLIMPPKEVVELEYSYKTLPGATYFTLTRRNI